MTELACACACAPRDAVARGVTVSLAEELCWSAERYGAATPPFVEWPRHVPVFLHLDNPLDVPALRLALQAVVARHDPLRSTFHETPDGLVRVPHPPEELPASFAQDEVDPAQVAAILREELDRPFDLECGPPLRAKLLRTGDDEHVLSIVVHHIVFDGWSAGVLLAELGVLYDRYTIGAAGALPDPGMNYAAYVARQRARLDSPEAGRAADYWRERLRDARGLAFGPRGTRDLCASPSRAERFVIDAARTAALRRVGQEQHVTLAVVLGTLFKLLLCRFTGATDIVLGMPLVDRPLGQFDHLIGLFLNMVLLRTDLSGDPGFFAALERVRQTFRGAYDHGHLPYATLRRQVPDAESLARVVFSLMHVRGATAELPGLKVRQMPVDGQLPAVADLSLHFGEAHGALCGRFTYKSDVFRPDDVRDMSRELCALVDEALSGRLAGVVH